MDNAIKAAIASKRAKASKDPAFDVNQHDQHLDEEDHADLAPDVHSSHLSKDGVGQNVNPTRPDKAGLSSEEGPENARAGQDEHIYPQEDLTDVSKQPRKFNDKNIGRIMSGDGTDPQNDKMGIDDRSELMDQDSPDNMKNHMSSEKMTKDEGKLIGRKEAVPEAGEGDKPDGDGSDAMKTAKAQMKNQMTPGAAMRGGLRTNVEDNQHYSHHPFKDARNAMNEAITRSKNSGVMSDSKRSGRG
jgi:hypothetical protein